MKEYSRVVSEQRRGAGEEVLYRDVMEYEGMKGGEDRGEKGRFT